MYAGAPGTSYWVGLGSSLQQRDSGKWGSASTNKDAKVTVCLNETTWYNWFLYKESKATINAKSNGAPTLKIIPLISLTFTTTEQQTSTSYETKFIFLFLHFTFYILHFS